MRALPAPLVAIGLLLVPLNASYAGPPTESCALQFIGRWKTQAGIAELRADGTGAPVCSGCATSISWWCRGNILTINHPPASYAADMTLSADGLTLSGYKGQMIWVRMGPALKPPSGR